MLTADISNSKFSSHIYKVLCEVADVAHYAIHSYEMPSLKEHKLLLVGGEISEYWAKFATREAAALSEKRGHYHDTSLEHLVQGTYGAGWPVPLQTRS